MRIYLNISVILCHIFSWNLPALCCLPVWTCGNLTSLICPLLNTCTLHTYMEADDARMWYYYIILPRRTPTHHLDPKIWALLNTGRFQMDWPYLVSSLKNQSVLGGKPSITTKTAKIIKTWCCAWKPKGLHHVLRIFIFD